MRNAKGQFIKGSTSEYKGANSPVWKGGRLKWLDRGKQLFKNTAKYCRNHMLLGNRSYGWKGGEETAKIRAVAAQHARVTKQKGNGGSYTHQEWSDLIQKFNNMCLCCKRKEPEIKLTADHIVPISMGGTSFISNIQPLCKSCNSRKSAKHIDYISQYYEVKQ